MDVGVKGPPEGAELAFDGGGGAFSQLEQRLPLPLLLRVSFLFCFLISCFAFLIQRNVFCTFTRGGRGGFLHTEWQQLGGRWRVFNVCAVMKDN